jgi:hypothetical protein
MRIRTSIQISIVAALILFPSAAAAQQSDVDTLYDDETLQFWANRYQKGIWGNFEEVILPYLTAKERQQLADVQLRVPLRVPGKEPYAYYTSGPPWTITMSAASLKFFDDLCTATAWLNVNGYGEETPSEYVAMLKYHTRQSLGGEYPPVLEALQIPGNALDDPKVDSQASRMFSEAIFFVLLHELGHALYQHPGYGPGVSRADARANEAAADEFALDVMRRIRALPANMILFYMFAAHYLPVRGDFASDAKYQAYLTQATHPLTADRMAALAVSIEGSARAFSEGENPVAPFATMTAIGAQMHQIAAMLSDPGVQDLMARKGRITTPAMLGPRHWGETVPTLRNDAKRTGTEPFDGTFNGEFSDGTTTLKVTTVLRRNGDQVTGEFYFGAGAGTIVGIIQGDVLYYQWSEAMGGGYGQMKAEQGGKVVTGHWGWGESMDDGGTWSGTRE